MHQHYTSRTEAVGRLMAAVADRVTVFHPVGYPGRPALIRTTSVIVDDVWSLVGATHFRRRGMTFDGSAAIASFDRHMENGYSKKVRDYRRALMAAKLHVAAPIGNLAPLADWIRLGRPESSFALVQDLLAEGGLDAANHYGQVRKKTSSLSIPIFRIRTGRLLTTTSLWQPSAEF